MRSRFGSRPRPCSRSYFGSRSGYRSRSHSNFKIYQVPFQLAKQFESMAKERHVSSVARGESPSIKTEGGFFQVAHRVNGSVPKLKQLLTKTGGTQTWWERRNDFLRRHSGQQEKQGQPLIEKTGKYKGFPTRRQLAMLMWMGSNIPISELKKMTQLIR